MRGVSARCWVVPRPAPIASGISLGPQRPSIGQVKEIEGIENRWMLALWSRTLRSTEGAPMTHFWVATPESRISVLVSTGLCIFSRTRSPARWAQCLTAVASSWYGQVTLSCSANKLKHSQLWTAEVTIKINQPTAVRHTVAAGLKSARSLNLCERETFPSCFKKPSIKIFHVLNYFITSVRQTANREDFVCRFAQYPKTAKEKASAESFMLFAVILLLLFISQSLAHYHFYCTAILLSLPFQKQN